MKLSLLMLPRNRVLPSLHLVTLATRKVVPLRRIAVAGKVRENGKRTGVKPMQEKGSLHFMSSLLTGRISLLCNFCKSFNLDGRDLIVS